MNRKEIIAAYAELLNSTKKDAEIALDAFVTLLTNAMIEGTPVKIAGFGTFEIVERAERTGRNPKTNEECIIPASRAVKFKVSSVFKKLLNE